MAQQSTVVSIYPREIRVDKPGIYPGNFIIPAAHDYANPAVLPVGPSVYYLWVDERQVRLEEPSYNMARAIVDDFIKATIDVGPDAHPGLFWVDRLLLAEDVYKVCKAELATAIQRQNNWYRNLVTRARDDWKQFHRMRAISDIQRYAAVALGFKEEWVTPAAEEIQTCPACKAVLDAGAIVCKECRLVLDKERYKELSFAVA